MRTRTAQIEADPGSGAGSVYTGASGSILVTGGFAMIHLTAPARYLHWGVILISLPNLVVIAVIVLVFALAVLLPLPRRSTGEGD